MDLTGEAIRLTRLLHRLLPREQEVAGLLALMLLTDARRVARTQPDGSIVPLAEQDRTRWNPTPRSVLRIRQDAAELLTPFRLLRPRLAGVG